MISLLSLLFMEGVGGKLRYSKKRKLWDNLFYKEGIYKRLWIKSYQQ